MKKYLYSATVILVATLSFASEQTIVTAPINGTEFVKVAGGDFQQGDWTGEGRPNERPVRGVDVQGFYISTKEVTVEQFMQFVDATGYQTAAEVRGWVVDIGTDMSSWERKSGINWRNPGFDQVGDHPVVWVDLNDAMAYAKWMKKTTGWSIRLPTESEWEFAARSRGKNQRWAGTSDYNNIAEYAWYAQNAGGKTHPVGTLKPNKLGLYDMSGNVWEWCDGSVLRGGSWRVPSAIATTTYRSAYKADYSHSSMGFRVVASSIP